MSDYPGASWATLARTAGRYADGRFGDDLARMASSGLMDASALLDLARADDVGDALSFDPAGLAWFAHFWASQWESPERVSDVAHLFRLAYRVGGRRALGPRLDTVWVQSLHLAGRLDEFRAVLRTSSAARVVWWGIEADNALPETLDAHSTQWLEIFNRPWGDAGLEPLTFADGSQTPFDRVRCEVAADALPSADELVSVVMPVYNPGESLRTAVRSLIAQSWSNIEVLICDDASTLGLDIMDELAASDDRVRIVRAPTNAGAYAARNLGLGAARGEFVTFNDADDWSHPRRIERQVGAVREDSVAMGSLSWSVRLTELMSLTVMGRIPERVNLSSILFRRRDVQARLGAFDAMRKGGDSEFVSRFSAVLGPRALVELKEPLALVQLTSGSLSRDDYQFLRTHPARLQYMADLRHWHRNVENDPALGYLAPGVRAPFPASPYLTGADVNKHEADVVLLANLSDVSPTIYSLADEVQALVEAGLRVALVEFLAPYDMTDRVQLPAGPLAALMRTDKVIRVLPGEQVQGRIAVIRDPASVETMPAAALDLISACSVLVVADYLPRSGTHFDPEKIYRRIESAVTPAKPEGMSPACVRWLPATAAIATELEAALAATPAEVLSPALCAAPAPAALAIENLLPPYGEPAMRVGISPLGVLHRPSSEIEADITALVPDQRDVEVWVYESGKRISGSIHRRVHRVDALIVTLDVFVQSLDALVVGPAPGRGGHLDRAAVAAAAAGVPLIASPEYRGHFADAALYLDERSVSEWTDVLRHDEQRADAAREASSAFAAHHLSTPAIAHTVVSVLATDHERRPS